MSFRSRAVKPSDRLLLIFINTQTVLIRKSKCGLSIKIFLFGRLAKPFDCFLFIFLNSLAVLIGKS